MRFNTRNSIRLSPRRPASIQTAKVYESWSPLALRPFVWYDFIGRNYSGLQYIPDLSGNSINAMLGSTSGADSNDPTISANGLLFDGINDYCVSSLVGSAHLTGACSVFVCIGPIYNTSTSGRAIVSNTNSNALQFDGIEMNIGHTSGSNRIYVVRGAGSNQYTENISGVGINTGANNTLAATWGSGSLSINPIIYANAYILNSSRTHNSTAMMPVVNPANLRMGFRASGDLYPINGKIHMLMLFDYALSEREVALLHVYCRTRGITLP